VEVEPVSGEPFFAGVNLPWLRYGGDFGANAWQPEGGVARPDVQRRVDEAFARLADSGLTTVRWWVLGDGRAGLRVDREGCPLGLDDFVFRDLDAGLEAATRRGIRLLPVLIDFLWFAPARIVDRVQTGGRGGLITTPETRWRLHDTVFTRIFERYRRHPAVWAWDLVNEPEWATRGLGTIMPGRGIPQGDMEAFLKELVALGHDWGTQPLTVGLASTAGLRLVRRLALDFYQVHWYDSVEAASPLKRSVTRLALDRPVLLGEFPTRRSGVLPVDVLRAAQGAGYSGALAWSMFAEDDFSGWSEETEVAMATFARDQGARIA
jgi:hypothetical protein